MASGPSRPLGRRSDPGTTWCGQLQPGTGFGEEAHGLICALSEVAADATILWEPTSGDSTAHVGLLGRYGDRVEASPSGDVVVLHGVPPLEWLSAPKPTFRGVPAVWRATFETASLPPSVAACANAVSEVWVPSSFNVQTFAAAGVRTEKIVHIPPRPKLDSYLSLVRNSTRRSTFRFLSVFSWQLRKGWDALLAAYLQEFAADDSTELIIKAKPFGGRTEADVMRQLETHKRRWGCLGSPKVRWISEEYSEAQMAELYRSADAFVLPTRGEGWGLPFMEAMAARLPVIGTGWGGQLDFMTAENSFLVDYQLAQVGSEAAAEYRLFARQEWAEPSVEHLRVHLRSVYRGGQEVSAKVRNAFDDVRRILAGNTSGGKIVERSRIVGQG